jgi:soluble lytic murein transglycosylase-like protein
MSAFATVCLLVLIPSMGVAEDQPDAAHRRTFRFMSARLDLVDRYDSLILKHSQSRGLNPRLVKAIIAAESGFFDRARSPKNARGLMQILPLTAEEMGVDRTLLCEPEPNVRAGTAYLLRLYAAAWKAFGLAGVRYRDAPLWVQERVLAAYNGGPKLLYCSHWPAETRLYVREVMLYYRSPVTELRYRLEIPLWAKR